MIYTKIVANDENNLTFDTLHRFNLVNFSGNYAVYNLQVLDETENTITLTDNGNIVGDERTQQQFEKEKVILGFKEIERGIFAATFNKNDHRIKGNWDKMVFYKGIAVRVLQEKLDRVLLFLTSPYLKKDGWKTLPPYSLAYKWVNKSDVEEIE